MTAWCGSGPEVIVSGIGGIPAMMDAIQQGLVTFSYDSRPVDAGRAAMDAIDAFSSATNGPHGKYGSISGATI